MNYIDDLNTLQQFIRTQSEVVIFPIGVEGRILLDFLYYTNSSENVCCMNNTEQKMVDRGGGVTFIHSIPSIPVSCMFHFRDSAIFVIASPQRLHINIYQELIKFGCKKIVVIKEEVIIQLQDFIKNFANSGQMLIQFMDRMTNKINELEYRIAEQNEICALHTKVFESYRNYFRGKKVVIVATGPTAKYYKPIPEAVHIGLNFAFKIDNVILDYLFLHDGAGIKLKIEDGFGKIQDKIFVGKFLDKAPNHWQTLSESFSLKGDNIFRYYLGENFTNQPIYQDICHHPLIDFWSVVFPAIQFALFTYPKELYLVGCDTSNTGHAYKETQTNFDGYFALLKMKVGYARLKLFAQKYYPDTKIISLNPVGLKGLFNDVYTEDYRRKLMEK